MLNLSCYLPGTLATGTLCDSAVPKWLEKKTIISAHVLSRQLAWCLVVPIHQPCLFIMAPYVRTFVRTYARTHARTYVRTYLPTYIHTYIHTYIQTYIFVVNFDALAQASDFRIERRQVVFHCWIQDSNPEGLWNPISSRLNACWQTDWAVEDQAWNLNSTARPYDQQAFSPPDPTAIWHSHLALAINIYVVVNSDALAQASDFRNERRQVVFLCWMQDSNPEGLWNPISSRPNACWQTDWAIEDHTYIHYITLHTYVRTYVHTYIHTCI